MHTVNVRVTMLNLKFRTYRSNRCRDMVIFRFSKMAAVRQLGFLKVGNFNFRSGSEGHYPSFMPNVVTFGQTVAEIWPFFDFSRWRPSDIFDFKS